MSTFLWFQCQSHVCQFRCPGTENELEDGRCPNCGQTILVQEQGSGRSQFVFPNQPGEIIVLLDNIRSLYNVGALFRTADGAGVTHLICSGITATPEHPKVAKTALGAEITSQWHYSRNGWQTAAALQEQGWQIWVIERTEKAEDLFAVQRESTLPIVLVTGNERAGVDPAILRLADKVISLPMQGSKGSLNVAVAFGIALYTLRFGQKERLT